MECHLGGEHAREARERRSATAKPRRKGTDLGRRLLVTSYRSLVCSVWLTASEPAWGHGEAGLAWLYQGHTHTHAYTHVCTHTHAHGPTNTLYWYRARPHLWKSLIKPCHHSNYYLIRKPLVVASAHALSSFVFFSAFVPLVVFSPFTVITA